MVPLRGPFFYLSQRAFLACQVKSLDRREVPEYNSLVRANRGINVQNTDSLDQRIRDGRLLDTYGSLITEKQRLACEMVLLRDLSLSEAAESTSVTRQGVHDLITRAREHMENTEKALGLLEKIKKNEQMLVLLEEYKDSIPKNFYDSFKKMLES